MYVLPENPFIYRAIMQILGITDNEKIKGKSLFSKRK
jgi:hypothetical protein